MSKLMFFQAELKPVNKEGLMTITKGIPVEERIGECPECGCIRWWLYPHESAIVREGGKPYCECLNCGYKSHL